MTWTCELDMHVIPTKDSEGGREGRREGEKEGRREGGKQGKPNLKSTTTNFQIPMIMNFNAVPLRVLIVTVCYTEGSPKKKRKKNRLDYRRSQPRCAASPVSNNLRKENQ